MESATSILLNKKFTPDDDRLNYQAYVNLLLTCNVCGEAVFLKKPRDFNKSGIKRAAHFSHFKDTGKNDCWLRTKSHDSTQNTDSEAKKQSLEKFQKKIQDIIDEGIIKYQKISCSQFDDARHREILLDRIEQGKSLVNQYKIDINLWLSRFYKEREHIQKFALSSYQNKSSEIQCQVFSNIVHYLCLPASENILGNILYYVFLLLNKEVNLNNDFEGVRSRVIELIRYAEWEKEYQVAQESLTSFNQHEIREEVVAEDTNLEKPIISFGLLLCLGKNWPWQEEALEIIKLKTIKLQYILCHTTENEKGEVNYKEIIGQPLETISISWHENEEGDEHLTLWHNTTVVATFSLMVYGTIKWNPLPAYSMTKTTIAKPINPYYYKPIVSENLYSFFFQWLKSEKFSTFFNIMSSKKVYPPRVVKLFLLFIAYLTERARKASFGNDGLTLEGKVYPESVDSIYKESLHQLVGKSKDLREYYLENELFNKLRIASYNK
ncbi:hypothetical protein QUB08_16350 [Microcoleus sp. BR0-C5]|uniref:hypothetical protein n=1 Tax=Microcoleus sp. BR0-C5 TaxID=2818713 RepID=UPI002FD3AEAB